VLTAGAAAADADGDDAGDAGQLKRAHTNNNKKTTTQPRQRPSQTRTQKQNLDNDLDDEEALDVDVDVDEFGVEEPDREGEDFIYSMYPLLSRAQLNELDDAPPPAPPTPHEAPVYPVRFFEFRERYDAVTARVVSFAVPTPAEKADALAAAELPGGGAEVIAASGVKPWPAGYNGPSELRLCHTPAFEVAAAAESEYGPVRFCGGGKVGSERARGE
jgi:hypothetical protein